MAKSLDEDELDWIKLREDMNKFQPLREGEVGLVRIKNKFKNNPVVPLGMLATCVALTFGLRAFLKGDTMMSQHMMRARIAAQGFTIVVAMSGIIYATLADDTQQNKITSQKPQISSADEKSSK